MASILSGLWTYVIEYETPRLVRIHNRKLGLCRRIIQLSIVAYVCLYALWLQRGYQEFCAVEASITVKIKGVTKSQLHDRGKRNDGLYTRVWDVADYVIPPAENGAFFVATNVIVTANQTRGYCPEDHTDVKSVECQPSCLDTSSGLDQETTAAPNTITSDNLINLINNDSDILSQELSGGIVSEDKKYTWNVSDITPLSTIKEHPSIVRTPVNESLKSSEKLLRHKRDILKEGITPAVAKSHRKTFKTYQQEFLDARRLPLVRHPFGTNDVRCAPINQSNCMQERIVFKAHGPQTGMCVASDRPKQNGKYACEVESWCPIEVDELPMGLNGQALMANAAGYTVFIKNSIAFPYFGKQYIRNNLVNKTCKSRNGIVTCKNKPCLYERGEGGNNIDDLNNGCQIFELGKMVEMAGGNFSQMAVKGGVVSLSITWNCDLDLDFMENCLPKYSFRILEEGGYNFRHAKYHEENRRTLYKMYGIKFLLTVDGRGGQFNLKNTILNIGSGLALLGVTTIVCDFLLMYIKEKGMVKQKKYDYIDIKDLKNLTAKFNNGQRKSRLSTSEPDLSPTRKVDQKSSSATNDSSPPKSTKPSLRLSFKGVKHFISSNNGTKEKSYKHQKSGPRSIVCSHPPPSSYSRHRLLQSPDEVDEDDINESHEVHEIQCKCSHNSFSKFTGMRGEIVRCDVNDSNMSSKKSIELDQDIHLKDYTRPMSSMSDCEPRKESLQISMDEKKFLGDEVILNHSILDHNNLSVSANYSTFPDIDNDGSIDINHEEYEGLTSNGKIDSNENKSPDENKKTKHLPRLASLDDI